jgi:hypothetical protein
MNQDLKEILSKSAEQKRITKLEKEAEKLKDRIKELEQEVRRADSSLQAERAWRMEFQRLMKAAVHEDRLEEYERKYYY